MTEKYQIELSRELDGRWIAVVANVPGVCGSGPTRYEALREVIADLDDELWLHEPADDELLR